MFMNVYKLFDWSPGITIRIQTFWWDTSENAGMSMGLNTSQVDCLCVCVWGKMALDQGRMAKKQL